MSKRKKLADIATIIRNAAAGPSASPVVTSSAPAPGASRVSLKARRQLLRALADLAEDGMGDDGSGVVR